jgi:hypothetical protein
MNTMISSNILYLRELSVFDLGEHVGWHSPQASSRTHRDVFDGDLGDHPSDVLA